MGACTLPLLLIFGFFAVAVAAPAAQVPRAEKENFRAQVDSVFAQYASEDSPGCALGVIQGGQLVYARGYGMANLEHRIPITPRTAFDIGSTSKQFTAMAVLLLAQEHKLSLDDDVRKYVHELPDYGSTITIRHLLSHTSGLRDYVGLLRLAGVQLEQVAGDDEALAILARQKELNFRTGEDQLYSNSGYFLLSLVAQKVTGKSLREFAHDRIFAPLGMTNTRYLNDTTEIVPNHATGYAGKPAGGFRIAMSNWGQTGDGAIQTTVEDLARWDENFYAAKVGGADAIAQLTTPGTVNGEKLAYALGLFVDEYRGLKRVQHGGDWQGYQAQLLRFPTERFSVATLCNLGDIGAEELAQKVAAIYLDGAFRKAERASGNEAPDVRTAVDPKELETYVGLYWSPAYETLRRISLKDGKLLASLVGIATPSEMVPTGKGEFRLAGSPIRLRFQRVQPGRPFQMIKSDGIWPSGVYDAVPEAHPAAEKLPEYAGTFYSEELGVTWEIAALKNQLALTRPKAQKDALEPASPDVFTAGLLVLRFTRDSRGLVSGFRLSALRERHLGFKKTEK